MTITTYNGFNSDGHNITISAGIHGNEVTPVYALMKMVKDSTLIDLPFFNKINTLNIVNGINVEGLKRNKRDYEKPQTKDLNRSFIKNDINVIPELRKILNKTDVLIDVHSSPNCKEFSLIDYDEKANSTIEWCKKAEIPYCVRYSNGNTLKKYIKDSGGISITLEINRLENVDFESAERTMVLIKNLLNTVYTIEFKDSEPLGNPFQEVFVYKDGLIDYVAKLGDIVEKGQVIANVLDLKGNVIQEVKSTVDGVVLLHGLGYSDIAGSIYLIQNTESWEIKLGI